MLACPNFSDPVLKSRWDAIESDLGRTEAVREYLAATKEDREMNTLEEVKQKIALISVPQSEVMRNASLLERKKTILSKSNDPVFDDPESVTGASLLYSGMNGKNLSVQSNSKTRAFEVVRKLAQQTGISFEMISAEDAIRLTATTKNPYTLSKGPAFFHGSTVYFVGDSLNVELAFHEFSHPIIRSIQKDNPVLFEKLFQQALVTDPSLLEAAVNEYADLKAAVEATANPEEKAQLLERYKAQVAEEVLVKALTKASTLKELSGNERTGFAKLINDIFYAIKQALRKLFGQKINIARLNSNTTMDQLAEMLATGGNFEINTENVSDADVVAYYDGVSKYIEDLKKVGDNIGQQKIQQMTKRIYEGSSQQIYMIMKNRNYHEMINLFADEYNRGDLQEMRSNVAKYANELMNKTEHLYEDMEQTRNEMQGLVNSMLRLEKMMQKMETHLTELAKNPDSQENIAKAYYYSHILGYWQKYIAESQATMREGKADPRSSISELLNSIEETMKRSAITINQMNHHGVSEVLWEQWQGLAEQAETLFNEQIASLKKRGASKAMLEKRYIEFYGMPEDMLKQYKELQAKKAADEQLSYEDIQMLESLEKKSFEGFSMTKEKVARALKGEGKDASWANSYLEGYMYNTDPVIGGFAMYYKNNMADMEGRAQARLNEVAQELEPLLKKAGVTFTKIGGLGQAVGFVDKIGIFNAETGLLDTKEVWTLLNPWKDYRLDVDKFDHDIRELEKRYNKTGSDADKIILAEMVGKKAAHMRKYFHQEYAEEYYSKDDLLENDPIGIMAAFQRKAILDKIGELNHPMLSEYDVLKNVEQIDNLWKEYRLLYSLYYANGEKKTGDDLAMAEKLQAHREGTRRFFEFKERPGVFQSALRNFENETYQKLKDMGEIPGKGQFDDMFDTYRQEWIERNTRIAIKPEFYAERSKILSRIKEITSKLPSAQANEIDFSEHWKVILDVVSGFRDDDGQPKGGELPGGRKEKVKEAQEAMEAAKEKWAGFSGLTKAQMETLVNLAAKKNAGGGLRPEEWKIYKELISVQDSLGLDEYERAELNSLFADLKELQRKEPTVYYLDSIDFWTEKLDMTEVHKKLDITSFDESNIQKLYQPEILKMLFDQSEEFKEWFEKNHVTKSFYNKETHQQEKTYERLYVWNVIKPNNAEYYETTEVTKDDGSIEVIPGLPKLKFYARVVKKEYRTGYDPSTGEVKKIVGVHIDNRGEYLPKNAEGSPYVNEEYFKLQKENPNLFAVLESLTKIHLKNQDGIGKRGKLYMDFPRFEKSNLELLQSGGVGKKAKETGSKIGNLLRRLREFIKGSKDTGSSDYNWKQENELVRADAFNDQIENLPIQGIFGLTKEETSTDIITSMNRYMYGVEHHKQLVKMNPVAQGIRNVLKDPENALKEADKINMSQYVNNAATVYLNKKGKYVRKDAFENFYEREFMGQTTTGFGKDWTILQNIQKGLMKRASFAFFALNAPSAIKNAAGAKFQALLESIGGSNVTPASMAKGETWSTKYMRKLSFGDGYKKGAKSLEHQMGEIFDFAPGRFKDKFGESITRTMGKDAASMTWLYNFRKWTELQASVQLSAGMLYKDKVLQNGKNINYIDAWELDANEQIVLKKGIDVRYSNLPTVFTVVEGDTVETLAARYNMSLENFKHAIRNSKLTAGKQITIDNTEFKKFRNRQHAMQNKLNGAYAQFDQPEMNRYILFRFVSFLRKFFTTLAMNRFGKRRWNPGYGEVDEGYYKSAVEGFLRMIKHRNMADMTVEDRKNFMKMTVEIGSLFMMGFLMAMLWGWDPNDEDRYEKLRARSGHLGFFGLTAENEPGNEFDLGGFISLHSLNLMMQIRSENEQFIPWPGYGIDNMSTIVDLKSLIFGPTTDTYGQVLQDFGNIWNDSPRQFYQRRTGPYEWQQKGGRQMWAHIAKSFGLTGQSLDPAQGITNFSKAQNRNK